MPSPFPGMDPYIEDEKLWPAFHHQFLTSLYQVLLPSLVDRYKARIHHRHYLTEHALFISVVREEHQEAFIEIRHRNESRLVSLVEIVSPANKLTAQGRQSYLDKRREAKMMGANIVEIDLLLQGQPLLDYNREGFPDWDFAVTVSRSTQPDRPDVYLSTLQKRLPRFKMPLANDDRDIVVDLQLVFARCYDQGNFAAQIDYSRDPAATLSDEDKDWLSELLKQQNLRS